MSLESNTGATKKDSNFKLITTTTGIRVSQACDRCRVKKIKCDGLTPCHNCSRIGFECKTSDKLTRRAFPKGYTENLEKKLGELEEEVQQWRNKFGENGLKTDMAQTIENNLEGEKKYSTSKAQASNKVLMTQPNNQTVQINNPIDQIFNLNENGIIIGNDNLNFESQFNHLLINLNLPFLKITNSHNYLLNDPNSYLYNPSYTNYNQMTNKDLEVIYNPLTGAGKSANELLPSNQLPFDIYGLFIKLINNFKTLFSNKKELDIQVTQYFLNYNSFIPIFDYEQFMQSYDAFHTMYPFMFTYDDATINGFNLSSNDYQIVNQFLMTVIQLYAMIMINDPTINLNLLLTHSDPSFSLSRSTKDESESILKSLYDFLPYINFFHVSIVQLQTYQLFLLYSLLTNNKEKSLVLSSLINSFIGILGINLNCKNLFFNDLSLPLTEKRTRVKIFWVFKVLLKCFNLKFGFKPSLNTTVINPVTIDKYFQLTPEKLSSLLGNEDEKDSLFETLLRPSVEFLNLMNIIIPSSFSPNYYQYLKGKNHGNHGPHGKKGSHPKDLDWILNDDDGDGNDGNLNYNFTQFLIIDENLANWRESLKERTLDLSSLQNYMNLPAFNSVRLGNLHFELKDLKSLSAMSQDSLLNYFSNDVPDIHSASQLIKIQLNFHYLLIRSMNYLNFIIDKELTHSYYLKIAKISQEILIYFLLIFNHVGQSPEVLETKKPKNVVMESLGIDIDEDGFVINDFSAKRGRNGARNSTSAKKKLRKIPPSPFNYMLNGLSMTNINLKKSIIFQMLYLLICQLRFYKKNELHLIKDSFQILSQSVTVFIRVFINYDLESVKKHPKKLREDDLFRKIMSDELKEEILKEHDSDNEEENELPSFNDIDWDDEEMDEDLKYLKILKFVKYKSHVIHNYSIRSNSLPTTSGHAPSEVNVPLTTPKANDVSLAPSVGNLYPESTIQTATKFDVSLTNESFANQLIRSRLPKQSDGDIMKNETFKEDIANIKNGSNHNSHPLSNGQWT